MSFSLPLKLLLQPSFSLHNALIQAHFAKQETQPKSLPPVPLVPTPTNH